MSTPIADCSGFCPDDVRLLVDEALEGVIPPTRQNIIQNMKWLIEDAKENDSLFFHCKPVLTPSAAYSSSWALTL